MTLTWASAMLLDGHQHAWLLPTCHTPCMLCDVLPGAVRMLVPDACGCCTTVLSAASHADGHVCGSCLQASSLADRLQDAQDAAQQAEVQCQGLEAKAEQLQAWLHEEQMQVSWDQSHCCCAPASLPLLRRSLGTSRARPAVRSAAVNPKDVVFSCI